MSSISFPDAEILSAFLKDEEAHVVIKDWRERRINLYFSEVALFKAFEFGGDIYECHILSESKEINEAIDVITRDHGNVPDDQRFVQISFVDDAPVMVVVFVTLRIEIENQ